MTMRFPPSLLCAGALLTTWIALAAETPRTFDLPAGDAADTLRRFAQQAGREIVYPAEEVRGHRTNAVRGELPVAEALRRLLAGTALVAELDQQTGAYAVRKGVADPNALPAAEPTPAGRSATSRTPNADDSAIELSPFVVTEASETGWIATETLAGTRLRTSLKDVPNQIETLTKEFMEDFALTTMDQAASFTANVESYLNDQVTQASLNAAQNPARAGRIRGLGEGTRSRNYFQVTNPTDNFNIERATVASGPNAILFGLGSPAGIFDATPARARMRPKYSMELQYDSEYSKRATFDANVVALKDKLAVRFMGLSKREYNFKKPNHDRDDRLYGALTFTPFKSTTLILQGEKSNRSWNRPSPNPPSDFASPWFIANQIAGSGYTVAKPVFNNNNLAGIANNVIFTQQGQAPIYVQGGNGLLQSWRNSVTVRSPGLLPSVDPLFDQGTQFSVKDPNLYPFDANLFGSGRATAYSAYTKTVIVEQKLARNLYAEVAYNREWTTNIQISGGGQSQGSGYNLYVDPNQFLPGTTTPNPYLGRLYREGSAGSPVTLESHDDWRATLSYELDAAQLFAGAGAGRKWLGRHRFSGLVTESRSESKVGAFFRRILDDPVIPGITFPARTQQNWAIGANRQPVFRQYLDSPYGVTAVGPLSGEWTLNDANGRPYTLYLYDTPLRAANGKRLGAQGVPNGSLTRTTAQIFAWQGYFLPDAEKQDRLVLTFGHRRDSAKSATLDVPSITQDFSGLYPVIWDTTYADFGPAQTGVNRTVGVVVRPLKWLTAFFNRSTTFDVNIGRYDPFGNEIPGANGEGKDYGLRFDLWREKFSLRVNRYENSIGPVAFGGQGAAANPLSQIENRVRELDPTVPTINVTSGNMRGLPAAGLSNYRVTSDSRSTGYEVELNFTPTPNWNIRINGSNSKATQTSVAHPWFDWTAQRLPIWQAVVAKNGENDAAGRPVTWTTAPLNAAQPTGQTLAQYYETTIIGNTLATLKAQEGTPTTGARSGRVNVIARYQVREGRLKGLAVGGAGRWLAAPVIGLGASTDAKGNRFLDVNKRFLGEDQFFLDAFVSYRGRLNAFGGLRYRAQLNVRNLLNDHEPIPTQALTTGFVSRIATVDPRVFVCTFGVEY
jgi:hypothetical protein